jgi:integrase
MQIENTTPKIEATIINTLIALKSNGRKDSTLKQVNLKLREITRHTDLTNSEAVKEYISKAVNQQTGEPLQDDTRNKFVYAYDQYCKINNIQWKRPHYRVEEKTPLIPTTENVNAIIDNATTRYTVIFKILQETGIEGAELQNVTQADIDAEQGTISVRGVKGHASGAYKLKPATANILRGYLARNTQMHPFPHSRVMQEVWRNTRRRTTAKLGKPDLMKVTLKSLRNYSGAQLYYKTRDVILVMRHLRHKKLETTMHYIRGMILTGEEDEYTCKATNDNKEATQLIEAGFQYVTTTPDGTMLFRKPK